MNNKIWKKKRRAQLRVYDKSISALQTQTKKNISIYRYTLYYYSKWWSRRRKFCFSRFHLIISPFFSLKNPNKQTNKQAKREEWSSSDEVLETSRSILTHAPWINRPRGGVSNGYPICLSQLHWFVLCANEPFIWLHIE